ncbi:MAG: HAD-IIIA family hydrolase [Ignavibacteriae bacterium]|nr:HAD-IIIA family hydrolase [Ignavibacteriota bacterium]
MKKAVFLDRDGVLTKMIYNEITCEFEPPHCIENLEILEGVYESLKQLNENDFILFLVSNQPDYAKGKTSIENLYEVGIEFRNRIINNGIQIKEYYYCYHHPDGKVKEYSFICNCRKPSTFFVEKAIAEFGIVREKSWFIGDRESDIQCGKTAKLNTVYISKDNLNSFGADYSAKNIVESVKIILKKN